MPAEPSSRCPFPVFFLAVLAALTLPVLFSPPANATLDNDFNDPKRCAVCHAVIFSQWEGSLHSQAAEDGIFRKFHEMVVEEAGPDAVGLFPITVAAKLNYRSMSQAFAAVFYPDGSLTVPVIRMAEGGYAFGKPAGKPAATP